MIETPPFPMPADDAVRLKVAELMLPKVMEWVEECGDGSFSEKEDRKNIIAVLVNTLETDGYKIAKNFEDAGFYPDAQLVDILDNYTVHQYNVLRLTRLAWVIATGWTTNLKPGDRVKVPGMISRSGKAVGGWHDAVVAYVKDDEGVITVQKGDAWDGSTGGGLIPHTLVERR